MTIQNDSLQINFLCSLNRFKINFMKFWIGIRRSRLSRQMRSNAFFRKLLIGKSALFVFKSREKCLDWEWPWPVNVRSDCMACFKISWVFIWTSNFDASGPRVIGDLLMILVRPWYKSVSNLLVSCYVVYKMVSPSLKFGKNVSSKIWFYDFLTFVGNEEFET